MAGLKRVFFVINSLEGGGAERVFSTVLTHLQHRAARNQTYNIELVLLDTYPEKYTIPSDIPMHRLDCGQSFGKSIARLASLARRRRPDLLFSFLTRSNCAAVLAGTVSGSQAVISERVHTSAHFGGGLAAAANRAIVRALYPRASRVIAVSSGVAGDLVANYGVDPDRLAVIHNPFEIERIEALAREAPEAALPDDFWLAIGRLVPNKNFEMLLRAYAASGSQRHLVLLGDGPGHGTLNELVQTLGLGGRVHLLGHVDNPFAIMSRARAFLMSSNAEGFPNALVEAMIVGLPVIATDCASGPSEILESGEEGSTRSLRRTAHGLLVPTNDVDAMGDGLRLLADDVVRSELAASAAARGRCFGVKETVDRYGAVIEAALRDRDARRGD